jgi:hypothetical protein
VLFGGRLCYVSLDRLILARLSLGIRLRCNIICLWCQSMDPIRLRGYTPDEFERICLELARNALGSSEAIRRGVISHPDQGIDIEAKSGPQLIGIQCKTGELTVSVLRDSLRQSDPLSKSLDRLILMCSQPPMPGAIHEFRRWSSSAETIAGQISVAELWDPDRVAAETRRASRYTGVNFLRPCRICFCGARPQAACGKAHSYGRFWRGTKPPPGGRRDRGGGVSWRNFLLCSD